MKKLKAEETLENPIYGCRRCKAKAESLRQKDRENTGFCLSVFLYRSCLTRQLCFCFVKEKETCKRSC